MQSLQCQIKRLSLQFTLTRKFLTWFQSKSSTMLSLYYDIYSRDFLFREKSAAWRSIFYFCTFLIVYCCFFIYFFISNNVRAVMSNCSLRSFNYVVSQALAFFNQNQQSSSFLLASLMDYTYLVTCYSLVKLMSYFRFYLHQLVLRDLNIDFELRFYLVAFIIFHCKLQNALIIYLCLRSRIILFFQEYSPSQIYQIFTVLLLLSNINFIVVINLKPILWLWISTITFNEVNTFRLQQSVGLFIPNLRFSTKMDCETDLNPYEVAYQAATTPETREDFWRNQARCVSWFKFPKTILDSSNPPFYRWYADGQINITYNMIDRYLQTQGDRRCLIWVSNMVHQQRVWTWRQVYENVCRMCLILKKQGVVKGDRVIIYDPMIPQALFAAWACARIGAIHSIVFGGFSAKQLAGRIADSKPKVIVTTSCGLEPNKVVNYVQILEEALKISLQEDLSVLIYQRPKLERQCNNKWISYRIQDQQFHHVPCQIMNSTDPLYILYTSGTTGAPKGIIRDQGGTTVALNWTMDHIMGINAMDTYFAASDIGWVVGHSFTIYGPLIRGSATVLYQGKPMLPDPGVLWKIVEQYRVKGLYTSPTGLRAIRKEDHDGSWVSKYDISSLTSLSLAGQRCDIPTYEWIAEKLKVLINDNYWQTQCGWIISCNYKNLHTFKPKPGSATKPAPGFQVEILNHENKVLPRNQLGKVCIKLPMPPSFMLTLYNNDQAFIAKYLQQTPGYYTTGDAGYFDEDGYLNVMTRLDDIINTAGHRLSTAQMEEQLLRHPKVSQAAVIAKIDELKGQIPIGIIVLKNGQKIQGVEKQLIALIRKEIGPVASFQHTIFVDKLPKTRSGKILRNTMKKMIEGEEYRFPSTIQDADVLPKIEASIKAYGKGMGTKKKLIYRTDVDKLNSEALNSLENHAEQGEEELTDKVQKKPKI